MYVSSTVQYKKLNNNKCCFFSILCKRKKELFKPSKQFFTQTVREPSDWEDVDMQGSTCVVAGDIPCTWRCSLQVSSVIASCRASVHSCLDQS